MRYLWDNIPKSSGEIYTSDFGIQELVFLVCELSEVLKLGIQCNY